MVGSENQLTQNKDLGLNRQFMKKSKAKRQKVKKYSVIVIPDNRARVWRWEISRKKIEAVLGLVTMFVLVLTGSIWGFVHYRHNYVATESIRLENAKFNQERAELLAKLSNLEQVVQRTERFANRIENSMGLNPDEVQKGIGPLMENEVATPVAVRQFDALKFNNESGNFAFDSLDITMNQIESAASGVEERLHTAFELQQDRLTYWTSMPSIWPTRGWVTSDFGPRHSPIRGGTRFHKGIDIAATPGTPIIAPGDGIVTYAGYKSGLGKTVMIDHGYGIVSVFGHNSLNYVKEGDRVKRGEVVGGVGRTGLATGSHLHYQVEVDGLPVDPMKYIHNMM